LHEGNPFISTNVRTSDNLSVMANDSIPFNKPQIAGREFEYLQDVLRGSHLAGDGGFTKRCHKWLENETGTTKALLTHSCTAALEMSAILTELEPGDEVIMPSFTFVSTANAVVLRRALPVFVDIRPDTMNIDENKIEAAISPRTRAILVVHYAGVACEMDRILAIAKARNLIVIEDAAQGLMASYNGKALGAIGELGAVSFHETKNIVSGEGGALYVNASRFQERAEIIREKGTNRSLFLRGQIDKYTWTDIGSSYLPSELNAAVLFAQLERAGEITVDRLKTWYRYHEGFKVLEDRGRIRRPVIPKECKINGHIYYLLASSLDERASLIAKLKSIGAAAMFHYVPLHNSPAGKRYSRTSGTLAQTENLADRLVRLPLWAGMSEMDCDRVCEAINEHYRKS
jgi:dTDP-4-amino-4,6-dideoxygalactose transaminase